MYVLFDSNPDLEIYFSINITTSFTKLIAIEINSENYLQETF